MKMSQKLLDFATAFRACTRSSFFSLEDAQGGVGGFAGMSRASKEGTVAWVFSKLEREIHEMFEGT